MSLLVANKISKNYGDLDVLENVSVRIESGDRIGLVGSNGAGKTSLLRALARIDTGFTGDLFVARETRVGFLAQDPPPAGGRTPYTELKDVFAALLAQGEQMRRLEARMNEVGQGEAELGPLLARYGKQQEAFERAGGYLVDQRIHFVLTGLGLDRALWHAPLSHLSGGQRTRVSLGRLLLEEPDVLLLDEPTNHLDVRSMGWLEGVLTGWKGALVVVSHDRYFLDAVATRIWDLSSRRVESYRGNYSHYRQQREERYALWRKEYERQQKYIRDTQEFVRRYKAGQRTKEAQGRETRLNRFMEQEALPPPPAEQRIRLPLRSNSRSGDLVLRTRKLVAGYRIEPPAGGAARGKSDESGSVDGRPTVNPGRLLANAGGVEDSTASVGRGLPKPQGRLRPMRTLASSDTPVLEVPDLDLNRGQVVALIGPNGAGKTTFVRTILEELEPLTGRVELGASVEVGYLAQRHTGAGFGLMQSSQTVLDALLEIRRLPTVRARTFLGQFLFSGDDVFQTIESLSGGERSRVALARLILQGANFLLLDEPTNHLDLDSQVILQDALRQFSGTIMLVTHDRALVDALATQIWHVERGESGQPGRMELFKGTWRQWQQERSVAEKGAVANPVETGQSEAQAERERQRSDRRRRQQAERREQAAAEAEQRIERLESRLETVERAMAEASLAQELERLHTLQESHRSLTTQLETLMEEWAEMAV
ncbi:MAG: ABC-F family ATP-binding cassette domain-containing protein [Caldilineaceae bacterium]|nr:ABC-F family ATP-binding cassette domain-containing protein [Caldilineaceae bacterium]